MSYFAHDDIVQIGTPPGSGAVGALRLSGDNAFAILAGVARDLDASWLASRPRGVYDCRLSVTLAAQRAGAVGGREYSCPARVLLMPAPASYTREDVAEIHLPGSPPLLKAALAALVRAGARLAEPGEFTFRAFRNGRITLGQAEAVEEVIRAGSAGEHRRALARIGDRNARRVGEWLDGIMELAARLEATLDFSEEELGGDVVAGLGRLLADLEQEGVGIVGAAARSGESGLPRVALLGLANAGKSSLYNALLGDCAALVSPEASTTRDCLRRSVDWDGVEFELTDNPGYHPEGGGGGRAAADQAFARLGGADLACWVLDGSRPSGERESVFAGRLTGRVILVLNKSDLPAVMRAETALAAAEAAGARVVETASVSAVTGQGVADLRACLARQVANLDAAGAWSGRESMELAAALASCRAAAAELTGPGRLELAADDMRRAGEAFSRVLGAGYAEEALARIFSGFCIGK